MSYIPRYEVQSPDPNGDENNFTIWGLLPELLKELSIGSDENVLLRVYLPAFVFLDG